VEARVCENAVDANGLSTENWSDWLSWGRWGTTINRSSGVGVTDGPVAKMDVDTLVVKDGKTANKIQYRVILHSGNAWSDAHGAINLSGVKKCQSRPRNHQDLYR
jgi:hypothetical protein